jgi:hypothetical protein
MSTQFIDKESEAEKEMDISKVLLPFNGKAKTKAPKMGDLWLSGLGSSLNDRKSLQVQPRFPSLCSPRNKGE